MLDKKEHNNKIKNFINSEKFCDICVLFWAFCALGGSVYFFTRLREDRYRAIHKEEMIQKQIKEYMQTFPNYEDSIRAARTPAELKKARENNRQAHLKIIHFSDSLRAVTK